MIGIIPYAGLAFTGFHSIRSVVEQNGGEFKWWHKLLSGGFAGLVGKRMKREKFLFF